MCEQQHSHFINACLLSIIRSYFLELSTIPGMASHMKLILHSGICRLFSFSLSDLLLHVMHFNIVAFSAPEDTPPGN